MITCEEEQHRTPTVSLMSMFQQRKEEIWSLMALAGTFAGELPAAEGALPPNKPDVKVLLRSLLNILLSAIGPAQFHLL